MMHGRKNITYKYGVSVLVGIDSVNVMATYQPVVQACGELPAHQADMPT